MAGDWIKMTHALPEKPEVLALVAKTGLSRFDVVGRLFVLWRWFDTNTEEGNALGVTLVTLDECLFGYHNDTNFTQKVSDVGWLIEGSSGVSVPNFDYHISESAKTRAQTAKRVAKSKNKAKKSNAESNACTVTEQLPNALPREEKRREEVNIKKVVSIPDWIPREAWNAWAEMRVSIKKPLSPRSTTRAINKLAGFREKGYDIEAIIDQAENAKWTDFYEPKVSPPVEIQRKLVIV